MTNNVVVLSGWLEIERYEEVDVGQGGARSLPVIHAWVYTDKPYLGGKHPVLLIGEAAQTAMAWARDWPANTSLPQVVAQGQVVTRGGVSKVNVRAISFMGSFDPAYRAFMRELSGLLDARKSEQELRAGIADLLRRYAALPFMLDGLSFAGDRESEKL